MVPSLPGSTTKEAPKTRHNLGPVVHSENNVITLSHYSENKAIQYLMVHFCSLIIVYSSKHIYNCSKIKAAKQTGEFALI